MDMLNKLEKKTTPGDESYSDSLPYTQPPANGHQGYLDACNVINHLSPLNDPSISGEGEEPSSTRHSSGCDDSGVFLEDLPYTPEHTVPTTFETKHKLLLSDRLTPDSGSRKLLSPVMRQYSIDNQAGLDSDAEKSDDLGLASSSIDSADDLDGDPLPSTLKSEYSPVTSKKKPPPVPTRKSISNGRCYDSKEKVTSLTLQTNNNKPSQKPTKTFTEINSLFESLNSAPTEQRRHSCQPESYKWKSEECLRSAIESKWSLRSNEKAISVKDRIAMFSVMESTTNANKSEDFSLQRYGSETNVKTAPSVEMIDRKGDVGPSNGSEEFPTLSRDTKWYSMYSIPPTTPAAVPASDRNVANLKSATSIPSLNSITLQESVPYKVSEVNSNINPLKVETEHHQYFEKPIVSNYPQTQLTSSKRYNFGLYNLKPIRTTEDLLAKKNNGGGLLSIIDPQKQPLAKLKGLVIPDIPLQSPTNKALPTIVSNDSLISSTKTDLDYNKEWKRSPFTMTAASCKTMSLPRTKNELKAKLEEREVSTAKLVEPPWRMNVTSNSTLPKYSPAFKRRHLELPHTVGSSLSPTPPSSITSPLSPPPSSPSSICSSNASSTATMQQNIFQFSLSHSKPVTPVLPEKPIMSPPSLPSDIEYEGDNSEDSSTSASPMISSQDSSKLGSPSRKQPTISSSMILNPDGLRYAKAAELLSSAVYHPLPVETVYKSSYHMRSSSNNVPSADYLYSSRDDHSSTTMNSPIVKNPIESHTVVSTVNIRPATGKPLQSRDLLARQQFSPYVKNSSDTDIQLNEQFLTSMQKNSRDYQSTEDNINTNMVMRKNSVNSAYSSPETCDAGCGNKNGFSEATQEVPLGKFRAQPLKLNQPEKNSIDGNNGALHAAKTLNYNGYSNKFHNEQNGFDISTETRTSSLTEENGNERSRSHYGCVQENQWLQNSDLIRYENKVDSDDEDDSHSSFSHQTEDSRHTTDDYLSDTTTDSYDKSLDPDLKPRRLSQQRTVLKAAMDGTDSVQKFRALAEKWEQRTDVKSPPPPPPPLNPTPARAKKESRSGSASSLTSSSFITSIINSTATAVSSASLKLPPSLMPRNSSSEVRPSERKSKVSSSNKTSNHSRGPEKDTFQPIPFGNSEKDIKNVYETLWSGSTNNYNAISSKNGIKDTSEVVSNNDAASNYSGKCNVNEDIGNSQEWSERTLQLSKHIKIDDDQLSNSGLPEFNFKSISQAENEAFEIVSGDDRSSNGPQECSQELLESACDKSVSDYCKTKSAKLDHGVANCVPTEDPHSHREPRNKEWKSENTSSLGNARRRFSTENKELLDSTWNEGPPDAYFRKNSGRDRADFLVSRNLSKSQISLHSSTRDPLESVRSRSGSYFSSNKAKSISVSDIRKAFETQCNQNSNLKTKPPPVPSTRPTTENGIHKENGIRTKPPAISNHNRLSSLESTASGDSDSVSPSRYGSVGSLTSISLDPYGSVTSLASTTSLISPQELQQLIEDANQSLEESCGGKFLQQQEIQVVVLHREVPAGSIGITLAGGADYEVKEITVHKVISGSLADRDGRIRKGDRVISINGKHLRGLSHREALDILKAPRPEVVLVISRDKSEKTNNGHETRKANGETEVIRTNENNFKRKCNDAGIMANNNANDASNSLMVSVELQRDGAGLGFSIEGGKDSPLGDRPLLIKRIFKGGVADKDGQLEVGDEIVSVNGQPVTSMTRTEAWNFLKKLPEEPVILVARKTVLCSS